MTSGLATLLPALLFAIIGLAIIIYFIVIMVRSVAGDFSALFDSRRLKSKVRALESARMAIAEDNIQVACNLLRKAFHFHRIVSDINMVERIHHHHLGVLEEVVDLARSKSFQLSNLPQIESKIANHAQLSKALFETQLSQSQLRRDRSRKTPSPDWAVDAFNQKRGEIEEKLESNIAQLCSLLDEIFAGLVSEGNGEDARYH